MRPDRPDHAFIVEVAALYIPQEHDKSGKCLDIAPCPVKEDGDRIEPAAVVFPVGLHCEEKPNQEKADKVAEAVLRVIHSAKRDAERSCGVDAKCF